MALLNSLVVAGPSRFLGTAYFQGVTISGSATFASLSTTGNMTVGGTLGVTGATTLSSTLGVTGATTFNGAITANASASFKGGIEIIHSTPYIDFHYQNSSNDWTSRIIENTSGTLTVSTNLTVSNTLSAPNITATNISTTNIRWTKAEEITVADLGGTFIVAPTIYFTENTSSNPNATKVTISAISGKTVTMTIVCDAINSDTLGGHTWTQYSKVKLSGAIGGCVLGSSDGYLSAKLNTTAKTANVVATIENASKLTVGTTYNGSNVQNLAMMMYAVGNGSQQNTLKVGMILTSYGDNYRSYLDIYGGVTSNAPVTRVGNLGGLTYKGKTLLNQWGLLTTNGYFTGVINAEGGTIGGFTLSETSLYSASNNPASNNLYIMPTGTQGSTNYSVGGQSSNTWVLTSGTTFGVTKAGAMYATSGKIGGWNIGTTTLSNGTMASDNSIYLLTADQSSNTTVGNKALSTWRLTIGNKFGVDKSGNVYGSSVTLGNPSGYHATMNAQSFDVYNDTTRLASFGQAAIIGNMSSLGFQISSNGLQFNSNGTPGFYVGVENRAQSEIKTSDLYTLKKSSPYITGNDGLRYYLLTPSKQESEALTVKIEWDGVVMESSDGGFIPHIDKWMIYNERLYIYDSYVDDGLQEDYYYMYPGPSNQTTISPYFVLGLQEYSSSVKPGNYSTVMGYHTAAPGNYAIAMGYNTMASDNYSTTMGYKTTASGENSVAMGNNTIASGYSSTAMGYETVAAAPEAVAMGINTTAIGQASLATGEQSVASGSYSIAMGYKATTSDEYSVAMGSNVVASGYRSIAIGGYNVASGSNSLAIGFENTASGYVSTAIGNNTTASGYFSTAIGTETLSAGWMSTAMGYKTVATSRYNTVIGKYNIATRSGSGTTADPYTYTDAGDYALIIGNGTDDATAQRSNALTVDWDGNTHISGTLTADGGVNSNVLSGYGTTTSQIAGNGYWTTHVDFSRPFATAPHVYVALDNTGAVQFRGAATAHNVTTTGFDLRIDNMGTVALVAGYRYSWMAISPHQINPITELMGTRKNLFFSGSKVVATSAGAQVVLSESWKSYDYLIITWLTNVEYFTDVIPTYFLTGTVSDGRGYTVEHEAGNASASYRSQLTLRAINDTTLGLYNPFNSSVNWVIGCLAVDGVKMAPPDAESQQDNWVTQGFSYNTATTYASGATVHITIPVQKYGYEPVGIVGFTGSGTNSINWADRYISSSEAHIWGINRLSYSVTLNSCMVIVLFKPIGSTPRLPYTDWFTNTVQDLNIADRIILRNVIKSASIAANGRSYVDTTVESPPDGYTPYKAIVTITPNVNWVVGYAAFQNNTTVRIWYQSMYSSGTISGNFDVLLIYRKTST